MDNRKPGRSAERQKRFGVEILNIGQGIVIALLAVVISMQISGIVSHLPAAAEGPMEAAEDAGEGRPQIPEDPGGVEGIPNPGEEGAAEETGVIFILGERDGRLALLCPDGESVYELFGVYVETLPDFDRGLIRAGIEIRTPDELRSLIEDYSS